jgi:WD40 repeat protein
LASCSAVSTGEKLHDNVVLTAAHSGAKLDSLQHNQYWKRQSQGATTSVAFGGKSRYLCLGDTSGAVCLWDLKKRLRVRQFFHDEHPSRQVSLDPSDKYVLSLSDQLLSIYNLREGTLATTFSPFGNYSYTCFHVSALEPHVVAVATSDGSILLYDITDATRNSPFYSLDRRHSAAITAVAISPKNPQVLASTCLDGTLMFFDTQTGETIHRMPALANAITSLTLHSDGVSCAVGTTGGEVVVYDMRKTLPVASFRVEEAVTRIQFAPLSKPKEPSQSGIDMEQPETDYTEPTRPPQTKEQVNHDFYNGPQRAENRAISPVPNLSSPQKTIATIATQPDVGHLQQPRPSPKDVNSRRQMSQSRQNEEKVPDPRIEVVREKTIVFRYSLE